MAWHCVKLAPFLNSGLFGHPTPQHSPCYKHTREEELEIRLNFGKISQTSFGNLWNHLWLIHGSLNKHVLVLCADLVSNKGLLDWRLPYPTVSTLHYIYTELVSGMFPIPLASFMFVLHFLLVFLVGVVVVVVCFFF